MIKEYLTSNIMLVAGLLSSISILLDNYLFTDWSHIITLMIALFVDFTFAIIVCYKNKTFDIDRLFRFAYKVSAYFCIMFIVHAASYHEPNELVKFLGMQINNTVFYIFLIHELISIVRNTKQLGVVYPEQFEKFLTKFNITNNNNNTNV